MLFVSAPSGTILSSVLAIAVMFGLFISLAAKWMADAWLHQRLPIVGSFVGLSPSQNPGIAFGILLPDWIEVPLIVCALFLVGLFARSSAKTRTSSVGFGLILGGAIGNIFDRIPDGFVTDFIQVGTFPIFNIADSCITIGVAMLLLEQVHSYRTHTMS